MSSDFKNQSTALENVKPPNKRSIARNTFHSVLIIKTISLLFYKNILFKEIPIKRVDSIKVVKIHFITALLINYTEIKSVVCGPYLLTHPALKKLSILIHLIFFTHFQNYFLTKFVWNLEKKFDFHVLQLFNMD